MTSIAHYLDYLIILVRQLADFEKWMIFESIFQVNESYVVFVGPEYAICYGLFLIHVIILADSLVPFRAILQRKIDIRVIEDPPSELVPAMLINIRSGSHDNIFGDTEGSCIVHAYLLLLLVPNRHQHATILKEPLLFFLLLLRVRAFIGQDVGFYTKGQLTL